MLEKIKPFYTLFLILIILSILSAFWQIYGLDKAHLPIKIEFANASSTALALDAISLSSKSNQENVGNVIGSKSGKKYYYPWCGTVKRIKPENQVAFSSISAARQAGYLPGGNCKGLK